MADRVTIVDVAREAGVAISTVSAALNGRPGVADDTRRRITEVAERMGWVPSIRGRSLSSKKTFSVGMVIQRNPRVLEADPFFWGFIGGVESVLDEHGYAFVLHTTTSAATTLERIRDMALGRGVDGIFLTDVRRDDPRFRLLDELHLPGVAVNVPAADSPLPTVTQDHRAALDAMLTMLLRLGHRRIAHVTGAAGFVHTLEREQAWRLALTGAGLADDLVFRGDFTTDCGPLAAAHLLQRPDRPTAVVCANDLSALGFMAGARALGLRMPQEVSVTGFDGIAMGAYASPSLTTVETSPHDLGLSAAALLLDAIAGQERTDVTIAPARLVVRESTGTAPSASGLAADPQSAVARDRRHLHP